MTDTDTRDLLATIAGLRQQLERVTQERDDLKHDIERYVAISADLATDNERWRQEYLNASRDAQEMAGKLNAADAANTRAERVEADNARLVEFAQEMCRVGFDGGSLDGCDILDTAVKHGLCRITEYHSGMTGITNAEYFEEGDAVYVFDGPLFRAARQASEEKTDG